MSPQHNSLRFRPTLRGQGGVPNVGEVDLQKWQGNTRIPHNNLLTKINALRSQSNEYKPTYQVLQEDKN